MVLTLLYALITFCAVMITLGMVLLAITLIKPISYLPVRKCGKIFLFARLRSAGGVYLSGGLKPATETSRILTYPPL